MFFSRVLFYLSLGFFSLMADNGRAAGWCPNMPAYLANTARQGTLYAKLEALNERCSSEGLAIMQNLHPLFQEHDEFERAGLRTRGCNVPSYAQNHAKTLAMAREISACEAKLAQSKGSASSNENQARPTEKSNPNDTRQSVSCSTITDEDHPASGPCREAKTGRDVARLFREKEPAEARIRFKAAAEEFRKIGDMDMANAILKEMDTPTVYEITQHVTTANRVLAAAQDAEAKTKISRMNPDCSGTQQLYLDAAEEFRIVKKTTEEAAAKEAAKRVARECKPSKDEDAEKKGKKLTTEQCLGLKKMLADGEKNGLPKNLLDQLKDQITNGC